MFGGSFEGEVEHFDAGALSGETGPTPHGADLNAGHRHAHVEAAVCLRLEKGQTGACVDYLKDGTMTNCKPRQLKV